MSAIEGFLNTIPNHLFDKINKSFHMTIQDDEDSDQDSIIQADLIDEKIIKWIGILVHHNHLKAIFEVAGSFNFEKYCLFLYTLMNRLKSKSRNVMNPWTTNIKQSMFITGLWETIQNTILWTRLLEPSNAKEDLLLGI